MLVLSHADLWAAFWFDSSHIDVVSAFRLAKNCMLDVR